MDSNELDKLLSRAKIGIMQKSDTMFFSALCSSLETTFSEDLSTAGTDGVRLLINPKFFTDLDLEERIFLLAHETLHVAYLHVTRCGDRDKQVFNIAADYVINLELVERGFKMPKNGLLDRKYAGMSTEEVYQLLIQNAQQMQLPMPDILDPAQPGEGDSQNGNSSNSNGKGAPDLTDPVQAQANKAAQAKAIEAEVNAKVARAIMVAEMSQQAGSIPGNIHRHYKELHKPIVNWRVVLQRFVRQLTADDYSWRRPNRRYLPSYLPKMQSTTLSRLDFAIDTSGSINEEQFTQFISEVHAILRMLKPKELGVYQFDHRLQGSDVVKNINDIMRVEFKGGGGTNPQAALSEFEQNKALGLVVLTDGYFRTEALKDPRRPVIWVVYDNPKFIPPFGTAVHFELRTLKK